MFLILFPLPPLEGITLEDPLGVLSGPLEKLTSGLAHLGKDKVRAPDLPIGGKGKKKK
jgi:hypothetical protein